MEISHRLSAAAVAMTLFNVFGCGSFVSGLWLVLLCLDGCCES